MLYSNDAYKRYELIWLRIETGGDFFECCDEPSVSKICEKFLDWGLTGFSRRTLLRWIWLWTSVELDQQSSL